MPILPGIMPVTQLSSVQRMAEMSGALFPLRSGEPAARGRRGFGSSPRDRGRGGLGARHPVARRRGAGPAPVHHEPVDGLAGDLREPRPSHSRCARRQRLSDYSSSNASKTQISHSSRNGSSRASAKPSSLAGVDDAGHEREIDLPVHRGDAHGEHHLLATGLKERVGSEIFGGLDDVRRGFTHGCDLTGRMHECSRWQWGAGDRDGDRLLATWPIRPLAKPDQAGAPRIRWRACAQRRSGFRRLGHSGAPGALDRVRSVRGVGRVAGLTPLHRPPSILDESVVLLRVGLRALHARLRLLPLGGGRSKSIMSSTARRWPFTDAVCYPASSKNSSTCVIPTSHRRLLC